ncbi:MAG TPA: WXG100 family type VII secretion target [Rhizomicrobium sp.]
MADSEMYVDPKRLRDFAEQLAGTTSFYRATLERLDARLSHLSSTWRDQEFTAFAREIAKTRQVLETFVSEATRARQQLLIDAERAEAFQRIQPP